MAQPNEITIRVSSPLLFIDDDSGPEVSGQESFQSLTVIRRGHNSDRGNTSSDSSPMPSLSHKAPIAKEEQTTEKNKSRKQQFEMTIRGENTLISIQSVGKAQSKQDGNSDNDLYEFINQSVQQIFQAPGREEIEKALDSVGQERKFTKKGTWKMLSRSAKASINQVSRDREERYPSIVLLQDPPEEKPEEDAFPKMVMLKSGEEKPKFEYRSKSMVSLRAGSPSLSSSAMNELNLEKHNIELERTFLEREKRCLEAEREGLEKGKLKIEKDKRTLDRSKSFLIQDQHILKEKKQVLREEKASVCEQPEGGSNFLKKEKLCLELEKQLLEDEKKIITEEQTILGQEKEMIEKEKIILGGEKNVLEEEKVILGKEKGVLEKQNSFISEGVFKPDGSADGLNQSDGVLSEIEDVFEEACNFSGRSYQGHMHHPGRPELRASPMIPMATSPCNYSPCNLNNPYPVYIPVYSLPRPYIQSNRLCCTERGLKKSKSIQTQTEKRVEASLPAAGVSEPNLPLPFGLLSGMFPRVVITSMNTYPHGAEERADNAINSHIREISGEEVNAADSKTKAGPSKPKRKEPKKVPKFQKKPQIKGLQLPAPDLTVKDASQCTPVKSSDSLDEPEPETEGESGIQTLTSESHAIKDDTSGVSDETISVETIHFGYSDDFNSNEAIFPSKATNSKTQISATKSDKLPLTSVGYDMFDKLSKLSLERDSKPATQVPEETERIDNGVNLNVNVHVSDGGFYLTLPGNISMHVQSTGGGNTCRNARSAQPVQESEGKLLVKRSELWHTDAFPTNRKSAQPQNYQNADISVQLPNPNGPGVQFTIGTDCHESNADMNKSMSFMVANHKCTCEAQVGTDDQLAGESAPKKPVPRSQLSPRTADLLEALRQKLQFAESERNVVSFGKAGEMDRPLWGGQREGNGINGLFFVRQLHTPPQQPPKWKPIAPPRPPKPPRDDLPTREYLCEECLATMRVYEDDFQSVQNIVDKFEHMSRFGYTK